MASDLREVLSEFVPQTVLDAAVEAVKDTEVAPEWWRSEMAKVAPDAKRAKDLEAELESIKSAPKRVEAYKRVGLLPKDATDASQLPKFAQDWLDQNIPADKLEDLEFMASKVQEGGFEASVTEQPEPREESGAEQTTSFLTSMGSGAPVKGKVTPEDYASWTPEKRRDFQAKNPEATEALKRGEAAPV